MGQQCCILFEMGGLARENGIGTEVEVDFDALCWALPRCPPRASDVHYKIPRCRSATRFSESLCLAARKPAACFTPRAYADHRRAKWAGTSLSVRDRKIRYKYLHTNIFSPSLRFSSPESARCVMSPTAVLCAHFVPNRTIALSARPLVLKVLSERSRSSDPHDNLPSSHSC